MCVSSGRQVSRWARNSIIGANLARLPGGGAYARWLLECQDWERCPARLALPCALLLTRSPFAMTSMRRPHQLRGAVATGYAYKLATVPIDEPFSSLGGHMPNAWSLSFWDRCPVVLIPNYTTDHACVQVTTCRVLVWQGLDSRQMYHAMVPAHTFSARQGRRYSLFIFLREQIFTC
jgi:hypothetical protein